MIESLIGSIFDLKTSFINVERTSYFENLDPEEGYNDFYRDQKQLTELPLNIKKLDESNFIKEID